MRYYASPLEIIHLYSISFPKKKTRIARNHIITRHPPYLSAANRRFDVRGLLKSLALRNLNHTLLRFSPLADLQGKDAVPERSGNRFRVGILGQSEGTAERSIAAFADQIVAFLAVTGGALVVLFFRSSGADDKVIAVKTNLNVLLVKAGKVGLKDIALFVFVDVHRRNAVKNPLRWIDEIVPKEGLHVAVEIAQGILKNSGTVKADSFHILLLSYSSTVIFQTRPRDLYGNPGLTAHNSDRVLVSPANINNIAIPVPTEGKPENSSHRGTKRE